MDGIWIQERICHSRVREDGEKEQGALISKLPKESIQGISGSVRFKTGITFITGIFCVLAQ